MACMAGPAGPGGPFLQATASASSGKKKQRINLKRTEFDGILVPLPGIVGRFSVKYIENFTKQSGYSQARVEAV
jgi:hypothetical protein